jgi:aminopeptidase N
MDRTAGLIRDVLGYYEGLLGVPCPYAACEIVFAPGLGPQAACLPGVVLVSEKLLQRLADPGDEFAPMVLAHEMAHLWFGCLVEGLWWDDLWLAEALATYLAYRAVGEALGQGSPWADFAMQGQAAAYRADSLPSTRPVSSPVLVAADALSRPNALTYSKGASVIRQLAALIGDDALRLGLRDYLTRYAWRAAALDDLVGCWSRASGRDLSGWAVQWLRTAGVSTLSADLALAADGAVASLAVRQEAHGPAAGGLRTHRIGVGVYDRDGGVLRRRTVLDAELSGALTDVPGLAGQAAPDAVIVNDGDLTFARIALDERTMRALTACALESGDPLTEAVCWNAVWDRTMAGELSAAGFTDLVIGRLSRPGTPPGLADLLDRARTAADCYAGPADRQSLRERLAAAALDGAARAEPGGQAQRALALAVAVSAQSPAQLGLLRSWLGDVSGPAGRTAGSGQGGGSLPARLAADPELRGQILATLAARGLATDADLDALAAADPVGGLAQRATCRARRPDPAAKEAAWAAAIAEGQPPRLAEAHARGIWVPGQEALLGPYRDRFFSEALPALIAPAAASGRNAQRLARLLYPALLADPLTLAATRSALDRDDLPGALALVLVEQGAILGEVLAARDRAAE